MTESTRSEGSDATKRHPFVLLREEVRRAFREFLAVPSAIILLFLLLSALTYELDQGRIAWLASVRLAIRDHLFAESGATAELLGTIASSLIATTAFSFGLLLIAVQQTAASMTSHVVDQFLRRRVNQFYFGFFVGLALFSLIVLASTRESFNPVLGASVALVLTAVALCLLLLLLYTTINQIRPVVVVEALHDHILDARQHQLGLLSRTRRVATLDGTASAPVYAAEDGFVVGIHIDGLAHASESAAGEVEVTILPSIGGFVSFGDVIARVRVEDADDTAALSSAVLKAIHLEKQRDLDRDPAYGIEQMLTIAWTSVSTSKSNPAPGLLTIRSLRDVLARWSSEDASGTASDDEAPVVPIVYTDDVTERLMDAFETLAVVSTESMQHQNYAEVLRAFSALFGRLSAELQQRADDLVLRILSGLGDHVLTADLEDALRELADALRDAGHGDTARAVRQATDELRASVGKLNSRATRVRSEAQASP